jgi:Putative Ig domain
MVANRGEFGWARIAGWRPMRLASALLLAAGLLVTLATAPAGAATQPVTVTTTSLPVVTGGVSYSAHLAASGGVKPYTWAITQGSLPAGLTLVPATGLIAGRASIAGTSSFTAQASDSENPAVTASANLSITVIVPPLAITTTSLPAATADVSYSAKLAVSGGIAPDTWSVTQGALPAGLTLNGTTGAISGKPTAPGTMSFTVAVSDAENPAAAASASLSISVTAAPLVITTGSVLPTGSIGAPYSVKLAADGGLTPYSWSLTAGALPAGLKLHATGVISGTPAGAAASTFTVQVSDAENPSVTRSATFSLGVAATPLQVTTTALPGATVGAAYSRSLAATGGVAPYTWSVTSGSLPGGLSLDASTGVISGTPATPGTSTFTVTATDAENPAAVAAETLSIIVSEPLTITTTSLPNATPGQAYSQPLAANGGEAPYTWSVTSGSLPDGLSLDASTGVISGTPTTPVLDGFTVTVTDAGNPARTAAVDLSIIVTPPY